MASIKCPGAAVFSLAAAVVLVSFCAPAIAAPVTSYDPSTVVTALQEAGYKAKMGKTDDGDPTIDTAASGNDIQIMFAGCEKGKSCNQVEFLIFWNCSESMKKCADVYAKWIESETFSSALLIEKSIVLYRHTLFDKSGISSELFISNLEYFTRDAAALMAEFSK